MDIETLSKTTKSKLNTLKRVYTALQNQKLKAAFENGYAERIIQAVENCDDNELRAIISSRCVLLNPKSTYKELLALARYYRIPTPHHYSYIKLWRILETRTKNPRQNS